MPQWLCNQLMRAFLKRDRRQIRLLNDCWYFYRTKQQPDDKSAAFQHGPLL
ncbi:cortex morphogenetic protein CmpA [Paenibacillus sp. GCM10027626]|uniref:cortex morphogenetic protein CmpA n=1 Tax=Paenibacillus sp. GCM10027626 TaxID=3273411 RepID=UPI0036318C15